MKVGVEVHVLSREMFLYHGIVAFGVFSTHEEMAALNHAPAVLFEPHAFASLEAVEFTAGLLFRLVFSCFLEFTFGFFKRLNGP